ncbi:hypothetical protein ACP_2368 [Acidobacterium capsulatum ATCC 51196]|uniref:Uncharacterized protein n=1 Tax=Acidobacterium capsulatum (strain ATCC 51196 / DSM 11244 / BCRC 80197 / JCM 7670 / NBRC 15755 / NCIMB 13165 / 161) TaxID=240015 RepID=C1F166_ACIC5|nr:hypothetical protein ACP_2368 [Acidobacterium capsulatum ATCC 51196]
MEKQKGPPLPASLRCCCTSRISRPLIPSSLQLHLHPGRVGKARQIAGRQYPDFRCLHALHAKAILCQPVFLRIFFAAQFAPGLHNRGQLQRGIFHSRHTLAQLRHAKGQHLRQIQVPVK